MNICSLTLALNGQVSIISPHRPKLLSSFSSQIVQGMVINQNGKSKAASYRHLPSTPFLCTSDTVGEKILTGGSFPPIHHCRLISRLDMLLSCLLHSAIALNYIQFFNCLTFLSALLALFLSKHFVKLVLCCLRR